MGRDSHMWVAGAAAGTTQLWVRRLDALDATPVPGTEGAYSVQWSPDGKSLLFGGLAGSTTVANLETGQIIHVPDIADAAWGSSGALYAVRKHGYVTRQQLGGAADTIARLESLDRQASAALGNVSRRPLALLPDESAALFVPQTKVIGDTTPAQIHAVSFKTGKVSVVGLGVAASVLPSGQLLRTTADGTVYLTPFDSKTLRMTGTGIPIARVALGANSGNRTYPQISIAENGTLIYLAGRLQQRRLAWLDANGHAGPSTDIAGYFWGFTLSPDGSQVAFSLDSRDNEPTMSAGIGRADVFVEQLTTGVRTRLTSSYVNLRPSWSADGKYVLWARIGGASPQSMDERPADASAPERLVLSESVFGHSVGGGAWLPNHRTMMVATYGDGPTARDIYDITPATDSAPHPFAVLAGDQVAPTPSPDGSLIAYLSGETSGPSDLYVQPFSSGTTRLQVSNGGASAGHWSHDGRTLYYWDQRGKLMAASIQAKPTLAVTSTREIGGHNELFGGSPSTSMFDVAPDGRILVAEDMPGSFQLILVRNWMAGLAQTARR